MNSDRDQETPAMQLTFPLPYSKDRPEALLRTAGTRPTRGKTRAVRPNQAADGRSDTSSGRRSRSTRVPSKLAPTDGPGRARPWRLDERTCEIGRRGVEAARALLGDPGVGEKRGAADQTEAPQSDRRRAGRAA
jgi:hypothetical protein